MYEVCKTISKTLNCFYNYLNGIKKKIMISFQKETEMPVVSSYILRLTLQHRALYCYLILSLWILILLGGKLLL